MENNSWGITRGFILPDGEVAKNGTRHEDIALSYLSEYPWLLRKLDQYHGHICDFMVFELGALKVGCNSRNPKVITYKERKDLPEDFWFYIEYYQSLGYRIDAL